MIENIIVSRLNEEASFQSRIYPVHRQEDSGVPAVVYERISTTRSYLLDGVDDYKECRYQISIFSQTYDQTLTLREAVVSLFNGYKPEVSTGRVAYFEISGDQDFYHENIKLFGSTFDLTVRY